MADPTRKALLKPFQLLGLSAAFGVFVVLIVLLATDNFINALIGGGAVFILSLVVLAMLVLSYRPNADAPVYLDRFQAGSSEPGAAEAALKVDPDAALRGDSVTPLGERPDAPGHEGDAGTTAGDGAADRPADHDDTAEAVDGSSTESEGPVPSADGETGGRTEENGSAQA